MSQPINVSDFENKIIQATAMQLWSFIQLLWPKIWIYIVIFVGWLLVGVLWQIVMFRGGSKGGLSPGFNRLIGSVVFTLFFFIQLIIAYIILGPKVIDDLWFIAIGASSFGCTGIFLRLIGFWRY